jgi:hypothetical protein
MTRRTPAPANGPTYELLHAPRRHAEPFRGLFGVEYTFHVSGLYI